MAISTTDRRGTPTQNHQNPQAPETKAFDKGLESILKGAEKYQKTGIVPEELYVCFDQNGQWLDCSLWESEEKEMRKRVSPECLAKLKSEKVDPNRLTLPLPNGKLRLLSSLNITSVNLPNSNIEGEEEGKNQQRLCNIEEVLGSVFIFKEKIELTNLKYVGRQLSLFGPYKICLPALEEVGQCLLSGEVKSLHFPQLKTIGALAQLDHVEKLKVPKLTHIGKGLYAPHIAYLDFPNLQKIGGQAQIRRAKTINAPKLTHIGGHLWLGEETKDFCIPNLKEVQSLESQGGTLFFPHLKKIHENLNIKGIKPIDNWFPELQEIGNDLLIFSCPNAQFPKLQKIGGKITATKAERLHFPSLKTLGRGFREMASNLFGSSQKAIADILVRLEDKELEKVLQHQETGYMHELVDKELEKRKFLKENLNSYLDLS